MDAPNNDVHKIHVLLSFVQAESLTHLFFIIILTMLLWSSN